MDTLDFLDPASLGGCNLYAYCNNNPVMFVDPTGHEWWHWVAGAAVVAALAALTIFTAGGAGAGLMAIAMAASGVASTSATVSAFAFATVAAGTTLAASALYAGFCGIEETAHTGSVVAGISTISNYGETALTSTIGAGIFGGLNGHFTYKPSQPISGTYLIYNEKNKVIYAGKGNFARMQFSMSKHNGNYGIWYPANNEQDAFIQEALNINTFGGQQSLKGTLQNKINSPGLKYLLWWL